MENAQATTRAQRPGLKSYGLLLYLLSFTIYAFSTACTSSDHQSGQREPHAAETASKPTRQEAPIAPGAVPTPSEVSPAETVALPPPKPEEVREVVARVYKDAVTIDTSQPLAYVVGDFNGDDSQDIAVIVRPVKARLEEINSDVANWIVEDPQRVLLPDPHKSVQTLPPDPGPVKVRPDDVLLTIIHGHQKEGWRNPAAKQAYLLNNAVGSSMTAAPLKDLQSGQVNNNALSKGAAVIKETLAGQQGFLYWTGAKYAWHKKA